MSVIPYERGAHYIFDRGYNDFGNLYTIDRIGAFFVVRAKTNVRSSPKRGSEDCLKVSFLMSSDVLRFIKVPRITPMNLESSLLKTPKVAHDTFS